ncbi:polysaccharide biosynthesis/export family protein [Alteraurantiacibacter aestuarii]|uniref:polysaccharide biosynthesis/export family protein n=1 Tax=Alteraurantiacibacter aestuarii TaxID=650004 RepID=UPI0031D68BE3
MAELSALPAPGASDYSSGGQGDVARPLDVLAISVFGVPELTREVRVGSGGFFDFPLIGAVQANGRSLAEIGYEIETRLSDSYVRQPDVTIEYSGREGQLFTVGGQVRAPGQYAIIQPVTLMQAVAIGGGTTEFSQMDDVLVFREVDGQRYIGVYDMKAIQRGNYPDPEIYAHDVIMVGDSPNRRLLAELLSYSTLLSSPLILLERVLVN